MYNIDNKFLEIVEELKKESIITTMGYHKECPRLKYSIWSITVI